MSSVVFVVESSGGRVPDGALVVVCHGQQSGNDPALPPIAMSSVARDIKFICHEIPLFSLRLLQLVFHLRGDLYIIKLWFVNVRGPGPALETRHPRRSHR